MNYLRKKVTIESSPRDMYLEQGSTIQLFINT